MSGVKECRFFSFENQQAIISLQGIAAVLCSSIPYSSAGVGLGSGLGLTGKLGRAWVGAWVHGGCDLCGHGLAGPRQI